MFFIIVMAVFSAIFVITGAIQLVDSIISGRVEFGNVVTALAVVGALFCLYLVITYPLAVHELKRVQQELRELKEQNKIESVYEPVNEVLYRKCEQK